jgi:CubicO group peptidase (beta-lactamase class C family)
MMGPNSPGGKALSLSGAFAGDGIFNRRDVHAAEIPAANGIGNARSLARIYAATIGDVDGVRLLNEATVDRARSTVTPAGEGDHCLVMPTTFGMGFMTHGAFTPFAGPGSFGHPGAGGSVAIALPEKELAFAYVMNQMATNLAGDVRAQRLLDAAVRCAG